MPPKKSTKDKKEAKEKPTEKKEGKDKKENKQDKTTKDKEKPKDKQDKQNKPEIDIPKNLEFFCIRCKGKVKEIYNLVLTPDKRRYTAQCKKCNCNLSRFRSIKADS